MTDIIAVRRRGEAKYPSATIDYVELIQEQKIDDNPLRVVTIKLRKNQIEELDRHARAQGVSRSELVRRAVALYLKLLEYEKALKEKRVDNSVVTIRFWHAYI